MQTNIDFSLRFPAIRGIQAGKEYYVSMCPLKLIPKLFHFDDESVLPELRAQRILNKSRVPQIANYVLDNKGSYTFSAITASIDASIKFSSVSPDSTDPTALRMGLLSVPLDAKFIINDGQHRCAAIAAALEKNPDLENETIAVVFFIDKGLKRSQQMFADLNRYAIRPSASISVLYDSRSILGSVTKYVALTHPLFKDWIELERSSISPRSRKLFTLSALNFSTSELFSEDDLKTPIDELQSKALAFWTTVSQYMSEWQAVVSGNMTAGEFRENFVNAHGIALQAIGKVGFSLLHDFPNDWERILSKLKAVDWSRRNFSDWDGRAFSAGRIHKTSTAISLTANKLKNLLGIPLSPEEQKLEDKFKGK